MKRAALLIGFGGPERPGGVRPFPANGLEGGRVPAERYDEVLAHYAKVGNVSPYNANVEAQKAALETWFEGLGEPLGVGMAFRHSTPAFRDAFQAFRRHGIGRVAGFVLSPFRSYPSFDKYVERLEAARASEASGIEVLYTAPFHDDPLFIRAQAEQVRRVAPESPSAGTFYLFTAHSIPQGLSDKSGYAAQFEEASRRTAAALELTHWGIAYQSRSGSPKDPWLGPDARSVVEGLPPGRYERLVAVPVGFLCENVELLFDLDVELRDAVVGRGIGYRRSSTVMTHPFFIELMGRRILDALKAAENR